MSEFYASEEEYEDPSPSTLELLSYFFGNSQSGGEMERSAGGSIPQREVVEDEWTGDSAQEIVQALLGNLSKSQPMQEPEIEVAPSHTPRKPTIAEQDMAHIRQVEENRGWTPMQISQNAEGRKVITINGITPEEAQRRNEQYRNAQAASRVMQSPLGSSTVKNLTDKVAALSQIKDREEMFRAVGDIESSIKLTAQQYKNQAKQQAEAQLGIPTLTEQLRKSEELDRRNPMFLQSGGKDSVETTILKKQLTAATKAYPAAVKDMLENNPMLVELEGTARLMSRTADFRMKELERDLNKDEQKQVELDKRIRYLDAELGENKKYLPTVFPGIYNQPDLMTEVWSKMPDKQKNQVKDAMMVAEEAPEKLAMMAVSGNEAAKRILIDKDRQNGVPPEATMGKLGRLYDIVNTAAGAAEAVKLLESRGLVARQVDKDKDPTGAQSAWNKEVARYANTMTEKNLTGENLKNALDWRIKVANQVMAAEKKLAIDDRVSTLPGPKPVWLEQAAVDPKISGGKPMTTNQVIAYINTFDDYKTRSSMLQEFKGFYTNAIKEANKSSIGHINEMQAVEELKVKAAQNWLMRSLDKTTEVLGGAANSLIQSGASLYPSELMNAVPYVGSAVGIQRSLATKE